MTRDQQYKLIAAVVFLTITVVYLRWVTDYWIIGFGFAGVLALLGLLQWGFRKWAKPPKNSQS